MVLCMRPGGMRKRIRTSERSDYVEGALPKKWYGGKRQANTGSAGARGPSTNRFVPDRIDFLGKASRRG